ncbi:MAG TPA: glucose-6-phosphate dehydrogenase, partial [Planctomycetota bacterium]
PGEAYEKLLLDAMRGDATLFARRDADEQAWAVVDPILSSKDEPAIYERGAAGPKEADDFIKRDGRRWRPL